MDRRLYGVAQAAAYLGISDWTIKRLLREGVLASLKVNGRRLTPIEELDGYIERGLAENEALRSTASVA